MREIELDELICDYINDECEFDEIIDFCGRMEINEKNKAMLTDCIVCYDIDFLYETLFFKFGELLSDAEKEQYRDRFQEIFDRDIYDDDLPED